MRTLGRSIGVIVGFVMGLVILSMTPAFLWYCIDDSLADLTGVPEFGHVPFTVAWLLSVLVSLVFAGGSLNASVTRNKG